MTCPDIDLLINHTINPDPELAAHIESCSDCIRTLRLVTELRIAMSPQTEVPEHLVQSTIQMIQEMPGPGGSRWERISTFVLAFFTIAPVAVMSGGSSTPWMLLGLSVVGAAVVTLLEPRLVGEG